MHAKCGDRITVLCLILNMQFHMPRLFIFTVLLTANFKFSSNQVYVLQINYPDSLKNGKIKRYVDTKLMDANSDARMSPNHGILNRFSHDYLDISDLAREGYPDIDFLLNKINKIGNNKQGHLTPDKHNLLNLLVERRMLPVKRKGNNQRKSSESESNSEQSSEEINDYSEKEVERKREETPKRFQVIRNSEESVEDSGSESQEYTPQRFNKIRDKGNKEMENYLYMQGLTRLVKASEMDRRRRLPQFLPKRVHWNEGVFKDLTNYWISGPRGRLSG